jgi:hypothetical protein
MAVTTVDRATVEPTDRSIPPVRMTKNCPTARTAMIAEKVITLEALRPVRKSGEAMKPMMMIPSSTRSR